MIVAVLGGIGSGKTMLQTLLGKFVADSGRQIYANYGVSYPFTPLLSLTELLQTTNGLVLLDEAHLFIDSRGFAKQNQILVTHWLTLTRHFGLDLIYSTQSYDQVDLRLRSLTDYLIVAQGYSNHSLYRVVNAFTGKIVNSFSIKRHPAIFKLFDSHNKDISMLALGSTDGLASALAKSSGGNSNKKNGSVGGSEPSAQRDGSAVGGGNRRKLL